MRRVYVQAVTDLLPALPENWDRCLAVAAFLTWMAHQGGRALGVEAAVLFDVFQIIPDGPLPWLD